MSDNFVRKSRHNSAASRYRSDQILSRNKMASVQQFIRHILRGSTRSLSTTRALSSKTRDYPNEPRVGVGVVIFRRQPATSSSPQVLLIKRGKAPNKGWWSFCGGSQELGETLVECAMREAEEEIGLKLRCTTSPTPPSLSSSTSPPPSSTTLPSDSNNGGGPVSISLDYPTPFTAVDVITRDSNNTINFHYAIVEVAARLENPWQEPTVGGDVLAAEWWSADELYKIEKLVPNIIPVVEEAVRRFHWEEEEEEGR
jgi:8-oxo-dGTP diphosphatase